MVAGRGEARQDRQGSATAPDLGFAPRPDREPAGEALAAASSAARDAVDLAPLEGQEHDDEVGFADRLGPEDDRRCDPLAHMLTSSKTVASQK